MALPAYSAGFVSLLVTELRKRNSPRFPERNWHAALREADFEARKEAIRRQVMIEYRLTGIQHRHGRQQPEMLPIAGRSREARELEARCDAFLASRGIPAGFHQY
jgi:hypothetical protein